MSYCLNPACPHPENTPQAETCHTCDAALILQGRYRAIKPLGAGGFSRTFLAVDELQSFRPSCVIKQFLPQPANSEYLDTALALFQAEGTWLAKVGQHPQLPELLAVFTDNQSWYLVQEWIDGRNLATILQEDGAWSATKVRQLLEDLLPVLEFIHQHQLIHRDIKPQNIIYRSLDHRPVLVDFGAAKVLSPNNLAQTGTIIGTAEYIAPEQARGKVVIASDIYGLGVTCIHLLTRVSPLDLFDHGRDNWVWRDYLSTPLPDVTLGQVLDQMIHRATLQRYRSAGDVLQDLQHSSIRKPLAWGQGGKWKLAVAGSLTLVGLGLGWQLLRPAFLQPTTQLSPTTQFSPSPPVSTERLMATKDCSYCDLSNVNLSGLDLSNVNLVGANLSGANLSHTILTNANLNGAILREVNLSSSDLANANLANSDLTDANFSRAILRGANLEAAKLADTNFQNADTTGILGQDSIPGGS
jgi:Ca-activated chloride channel homolog